LLPDVNDESVLHTLQLLHPKLEAQILLAKQVPIFGFKNIFCKKWRKIAVFKLKFGEKIKL
jgi:hypothetical protein